MSDIQPRQRFDRIRVPSAYQMVASAIEQEILAGRLSPGDEIGTEAELVRQFGVNRSTVREGIRVLEQSGLVRREAGRKLFVCLPQYRSLSTRMSRAMMLQEVTFLELFDTAMILELGAVEAAIDNHQPGDIEALEANQAEAETAIGDPYQLARVDTEFHALIAQISRNRVLELAREPAALLFFPTTELICRMVPEGAARMVKAHRQIIDTIAQRDRDAALSWMQRHVKDWRKGFERAGWDVREPIGRMFARLSPKSAMI
jgi:GntR family transcriptional regulator, transcriptional repressor for pyruvate dehydrogenase complex